MVAGDELTEARAALAHDRLGWALRKAWEAAFAAEDARDADALQEIRALAAQLEERTAGGDREEAHRLIVYSTACGEDIRAGIPHDSTLARLFRRT